MDRQKCKFDCHHYYVADVAQVEKEGTVTVMSLCTNCGDFQAAQYKVTEDGAPMKLLTNKIKSKE